MSGIFGKVALTATTVTPVTTAVAAGKVRTVNITILNRGAVSAAVWLAVTDAAVPGGAVPDVADWLESGAALPPNGVLERGAVAMSPGEIVYAWADIGTVSVQVRGLERDDI